MYILIGDINFDKLIKFKIIYLIIYLNIKILKLKLLILRNIYWNFENFENLCNLIENIDT